MNSKKKAFTTVALLFVLVLAVVSITACSVNKATSVTDAEVPGGTYTGTILENGELTGSGIITFTNGNIYEGAVVQGIPEGDGVMTDVISEGTYTGGFVAGKYQDAAAKMEFDNGGIYTGAFENGKMKGEGVFTWPDGFVFTGTFAGTGGVEGSVGAIDATGVLDYKTGITFEGTLQTGNPKSGTFYWPNKSPKFTSNNELTGFLSGWGDLDMGNGIIYTGSMGLGLLVPLDGFEERDVTVQYPVSENGDYDGEKFIGKFVHNNEQNVDELKGTIYYKDYNETTKPDSKLENVKIALDFSFSYRYSGTLTQDGITYTGEMRDRDVPFGTGSYKFTDATVEITEGHGWLSGIAKANMGGGLIYEGPINAIEAEKNGLSEIQPYLTNDTVKIIYVNGVFTGKFENVGTAETPVYILRGNFNDGKTDVDMSVRPGWDFAPVLEKTATEENRATIGGLGYVGAYYTDALGANPVAYGVGTFYWPNDFPKAEGVYSASLNGIVKLTMADGGIVYEGGFINVPSPTMGKKTAKITYVNKDVFVGEWKKVNDVWVLEGTLTTADGKVTVDGTVSGGFAFTFTPDESQEA